MNFIMSRKAEYIFANQPRRVIHMDAIKFF